MDYGDILEGTWQRFYSQIPPLPGKTKGEIRGLEGMMKAMYFTGMLHFAEIVHDESDAKMINYIISELQPKNILKHINELNRGYDDRTN